MRARARARARKSAYGKALTAFVFLSAAERYAPETKRVKTFFSSRIVSAGALTRRATREP